MLRGRTACKVVGRFYPFTKIYPFRVSGLVVKERRPQQQSNSGAQQLQRKRLKGPGAQGAKSSRVTSYARRSAAARRPRSPLGTSTSACPQSWASLRPRLLDPPSSPWRRSRAGPLACCRRGKNYVARQRWGKCLQMGSAGDEKIAARCAALHGAQSAVFVGQAWGRGACVI